MKRQVQLFPNLVLRIAGDGFDAFAKTELQETRKTLNELYTIREAFAIYREKMSEALHPVIGATKDTKKRNLLIKVRRDIYNCKPAEYMTSEIMNDLPKDVQDLVLQTLQLVLEIQTLTAKAEKQFIAETKQSKKAFTKLLDTPNFQNGLVLSSNTLFDSVKKYKELHDTDKQFPKIERSLAKYLSRMYTKPTPFSGFTQLAATTFTKSNELFPQTNNYPQASYIELNHQLYHYIFGLLVQNDTLRPYFPIKLNDSIRIQENQFVFITNNFNRESFQRITITPALEYIYNAAKTKNTWVYDVFVDQLITDVFQDTPKADLTAYILQLLEFGFFEYDFGISGLDLNWDRKLIKLLEPIATLFPYIASLIESLQSLRKLQQRYATLEPAEREQKLRETFKQFRSVCAELHQAAGLPQDEQLSFKDGYEEPKKPHKHDEKNEDEVFKHKYATVFTYKPQNLLFEDTYIKDFVPVTDDLHKNLAVLGNLLNHVEVFDSCVEDMYKMTTFFKEMFGTTTKVDLLEFYEAYYRYQKDHEKTKEEKKVDPAVKTKRASNEKLLNEFIKKLKAQIQKHDEIIINTDDISAFPVLESNKNASFGALFQTYDTPNSERNLVMNSFIIGHGRMYTRFLPFFPQEVTSSLLEWNQKDNPDALLAEVTDSSAFNANLHPRVMPYEISMPGSYNELPKEKQIAITDLEIVHNGHVLELWHKQLQKRVFIFDLGFQGLAGRSELYTFLSKFSLCEHHNASAILKPINSAYKELHADVIEVQPRIRFTDHIILQRKAWKMKEKQLPKRKPEESDWEYFLRVNTWRNSLHIPDEIFMTLGNGKPQYVSFNNPLLVPLFEKAIEKTTGEITLTITEMSPTTDQLHTVRGEKTVTEFFAQWYY